MDIFLKFYEKVLHIWEVYFIIKKKKHMKEGN